MQQLTELRGKRSQVAVELKNMMENHKKSEKAWESSDQEKYDASVREIEAIDQQVKNIQDYINLVGEQKIDNQLHEASMKIDTKSTVKSLHNKWLRQGDNALNAAEWGTIQNTLSVGTASQGGYSVQSEVAKVLIDQLKAFGGMRSVSTIMATEMGNPLSFPTSDGTAEVGELIAENTTATAADPVFGTVSLAAYKYSSKVVAVPFELLQDSQIDIEAFVNRRLTTRVGRITNTHFTTGTGSGQPNGAVTAAGAGKVGTTGQTLTVIFDDLVDLVHAVDPAYRMSDSSVNDVAFMMSDSAFKVVRKLKDTSGRPIFLPGYDGLSGSMSDSLLGYRVVINQDVPVMAANAKSILFGDFSQYYIRDVMNLSLFRFTDSAYTKLGQVGFLMWMRSGGNLIDSFAIKYYQNSAT